MQESFLAVKSKSVLKYAIPPPKWVRYIILRTYPGIKELVVMVLWMVLSAVISDMLHKHLCFAPTRIRPIATGSGMYLRLWGYLCEFDPETESVSGRRVTMSLPSKLTRWMGADPESFSMKAYPVDDAVVFMIIMQYHSRKEFEIDGEKRSAHRFGAIDLIEGRKPKG